MPDDRRFGVLWMGHEALQAAFDLDGAFNDVSLALLRGTDPDAVIDRLDRLLGRYGGIGAYARADQLSNWFLMNEIAQLAHAVDDPAHHLPRRGRVPHQHGARPADRGGAQRDRTAQGVRLQQSRHRAALRALRARHRRGRRAARLDRGVLAGTLQHARLRRLLPLPVPAVPAEPASRSSSPPRSASVPRCSAPWAPYARPPPCRRPRRCARPPHPCSAGPH